MRFQTLYQEAKWKKQYQKQLQLSKQEQIKHLSSMNKVNPHSTLILANKIYEKLAVFQDQEPVNIETSIPLLHATGILQSIETIESAKLKLDKGQFTDSRLKEEARFVYCLWKMIDEEEIQTRQLKQIVYMLNEQPYPQLNKLLSEMYSEQANVSEFVQTWKQLVQHGSYYRAIQKLQKKNNRDRQVQRNQFCQIPLKERCHTNDFKDIQSCFLKDALNTSKEYSKFQKMDLATMQSQYGSRNKQNIYIDRYAEQCLVDRLYQNDKYQMREAQKKVEDEKRVRAQMQDCTFKPQTNNQRLRSLSNPHRSKSINGYEKSVNRMKVGNEKQRILKEKKEYKPTGENYYKLRQKKIKAPSFLSRKPVQQPVLFLIEFDLGRHKIKVKVHQNDSDDEIARNLCKIYTLKQDYYQQIRMVLKTQRETVEAQRSLI